MKSGSGLPAPVTVPVRLGCGAVMEDGIQVSSTMREQNKLLTHQYPASKFGEGLIFILQSWQAFRCSISKSRLGRDTREGC